jgi:symplekin
MPQLAPTLGVPLPGRGMYDRQGPADGGRATEVKDEKEDVLDPLEMDMDDDELLVSLSSLLRRGLLCTRHRSARRKVHADIQADDESDVDENITFADFTLPPPEPLSPQERDELIDDILERISASGQEMSGPVMSTGGNDPWAWLTSATSDQVKVEGKDGLRGIMDVKEMWMILLSRLATRTGTLVAKAEQGANEQDVAVRSKGRARVAEFIAADFAARYAASHSSRCSVYVLTCRSKFAALWLNEEWFSEKTSLGTTTSYTTHLVSILSSHLSNLDAHSSSSAAARSLSLFLANVPEIPLSLVDQLASMAEDADRAIVGFLALRDLVESRPPVRAKALSCLLDLCVHPDRKVRVLGISTVRRWVPGHAVSKEVVGFAE